MPVFATDAMDMLAATDYNRCLHLLEICEKVEAAGFSNTYKLF